MIALEKRPTLSAVLRRQNRHGQRTAMVGIQSRRPSAALLGVIHRPALLHGFGAPIEGLLRGKRVHYTFSSLALGSKRRNELLMTDQIVIAEKTSQAKDIRSAVGSRYGDILPAEGHLFD